MVRLTTRIEETPKLILEFLATIEAPLLDEAQGCASLGDFLLRGNREERAEVRRVLIAPFPHREDLHGNQVMDTCHRQDRIGLNFHRSRCRNDFRFDAARGAE